jgi:tetrapyrrole methylase family protein / MazG family protein
MGITIIGLGPGNGRFLTREAWEILSTSSAVYLRTSRHPAVNDLPEGLKRYSFDHLYESVDRFADVYAEITRELLRIAKGEDVVYAVPGHPYVGESTVSFLVDEAKKIGLPVRIVAGLSFVEPVLTAVSLDALDGLQIYDALIIASYLYPPCNVDAPMVLGQVYNRLVAGEVKLALSSIFPEQHLVTLIHSAGEPDELVEIVPLYAIDHSKNIDHLTSLFVPPTSTPATLPALANTIAILRSPEGCPWDIEQTPQSMRDDFLEEAYEVLDALDSQNTGNLQEELGDLLYHLVMQAQMASEAEEFTLNDVIAGIDAKLRRRHPHVWGDLDVKDSAEVLQNWELIKQQEKSDRSNSVLEHIPLFLPALARSQRIQNRVGKVGFDWTEISGIYSKIDEEIGEVKEAQSVADQQAELGDLLFAIVNLARWLDVDAESALREANLRFRKRFQLVEKLAVLRQINLEQQNLAQLEELWEEAKEMLAKVNSDAKV